MAVHSPTVARKWFLGNEVLGALLLVAGLVAVTTLVRAPLVQIPGYLLVVGSDLIQNPLLPGLSGRAYTAFFAVYLYGVAVTTGALYRWGRSFRARE